MGGRGRRNVERGGKMGERGKGKNGMGGWEKMEWGNSVEDPDTDNRMAAFSFTDPALLTDIKMSI
jgi:hypothetical protein